jgi:hypothetical protein
MAGNICFYVIWKRLGLCFYWTIYTGKINTEGKVCFSCSEVIELGIDYLLLQ